VATADPPPVKGSLRGEVVVPRLAAAARCVLTPHCAAAGTPERRGSLVASVEGRRVADLRPQAQGKATSGAAGGRAMRQEALDPVLKALRRRQCVRDTPQECGRAFAGFSALISLCEKGLALLDEMRTQRVEPNVISYSAAVSCCEKGQQWQKGQQSRRVPDK